MINRNLWKMGIHNWSRPDQCAWEGKRWRTIKIPPLCAVWLYSIAAPVSIITNNDPMVNARETQDIVRVQHNLVSI